MSKYYKAEDVIRKYAEMIADEAYWEHGVGNGNPDKEDLDIARDYYSDLPTIEVSEDCISRVTALDIAVAFVGAEMVDRMLTAPSVVPTTEQSCETCKHQELYECRDCKFASSRFASKWERIEE